MVEPFLMVLQESARPMFDDKDDDDDDEDVDDNNDDDEQGGPFLMVLQDSARADGWVETKLTPNLRSNLRIDQLHH